MTTSSTSTTVRPNVIIRKRSSGLAFMILDAAGKHNLLSSHVIDEFADNIQQAKNDPEIKALAIISGKSDTFLSGADLHEIMKFTAAEQAEELSRRGQRIFNTLANIGKPTVAAIHGVCLGGGLELVLCCNRRIATDSPITLIGLPETKLGFVPGLGGTQRLPRLVGVRNSLEIILTGDPVSAHRAFELGIIDKLSTQDKLLDDAEKEALDLLKSGDWRSPDEIASKAAGELTPEKMKSLFAMAERSVRIRTRGNYPAQTQVLEVMKEGLYNGIEAGLDLEAKTFANLSVSEVSKNLVFLFFTTEFARQSAVASASKEDTPQVKTIGIIGAGMMGSTIAQLAAQNGFDVLFQSAQKERHEYLTQRAQEINARLLKANQDAKSNQNPRSKQDANSNQNASSNQDTSANQQGKSNQDNLDNVENKNIGTVKAVVNDEEFASADLIIEACAENVETKTEVFKRLCLVAAPEAVIASNTSSLSISAFKRSVPEKVSLVGMHFFHPVDKMPLVEVIAPAGTNKSAIAQVTAFLAKLGKTPVTVKDSPCFLVNRLLYCYLVEAARIAAEKTPINWVEEAAIDFGMPMGPMALLDEVGLDVSNMVAKALEQAFGERMAAPPELDEAMRIGMIGKKTGRGIYSWDESGKKLGFDKMITENIGLVVTDTKVDKELAKKLTMRMILPMIDEAARCLEEKVVRRPREIDLCMVLGMGFPPFRGGLLRYADALGLDKVIEGLNELYSHSPKRTISPYLVKLASENRGFYARSAGEEG
jgi:3-hydroxyacyl-CoA dehydrogenase/enoyl-CoA hydratase/3-hydroxybutyryl-CoA epimerase